MTEVRVTVTDVELLNKRLSDLENRTEAQAADITRINTGATSLVASS